MVNDVTFSFKLSNLYDWSIVGWEVYKEESADYASSLIKRICLKQDWLTTESLVLHSDNGSSMKGAAMLATLYQLGITPSNSRARVSNDNPYAESLFKTLKYGSNYQPKGGETLEEVKTRYLLNVKKFTRLPKQNIQSVGMDLQPMTGVFWIPYIWIQIK